MGATPEVKLPLMDSQGHERGSLSIYLLPGKNAQTLLDLRNEPERPAVLELVQLMEAQEYRYEVHMPGDPHAVIRIEPSEVFQPDTNDGRRGRLRTGLYTGMLPVQILAGESEVGRTALEVRSRKLDYLRHYQWMLRDIAEQLTEAVMERFAPTEQRFVLDEAQDAHTLYQRFSFLKHVISGEAFEAAVQQILAHPHRAWVEDAETRPPGRGLPAGSGVARQIAACSGPRTSWPGGVVEHLPARMFARQTVETLDTPENRFVRFALTCWQEVTGQMERVLDREKENGPLVRGRREVVAVLQRLDELLSSDLFRQVGPLTQFPAASQVLQKRAGYREIFRAYVQFEAGAAVSWEGGEDVYSAGQRNVATLYEYWVFLQLARLVGEVCNEGFSEDTLFRLRPGGLVFSLKQGRQRLVTGVVSRHGRLMRLELWYNRSFERASGPSWTMPMRPDCSLRIRPERGSSAAFEEVWLHFDAKYRIDGLKEIFGTYSEPNEDNLERENDALTVKRADLLKMHAYRDAIRRSAGAYVIYPGDDERYFNMYREVLPGLGAFALRPSDGGEVEGKGALQKFLEDVLDHLASQVTEHERERWWLREVHADRYRFDSAVPAAPFITRPPADTEVLLGYVRSEEHLNWVRNQRLYNLRADSRSGSIGLGSRELVVDLVVLYNVRLQIAEIWRVLGDPTLRTGPDLADHGYPNPRGELYYCLGLGPIPPEHWPEWLSAQGIEVIRNQLRPNAKPGEPVAATWLDLARLGAR